MGATHPRLYAALLVWLLALSTADALATPGPPREEHDALGRVTRRANGERVTYPVEPVRRTRSAPRVASRGEGGAGPSGTLDVTEEWRRSIFGYAIGLSGLHIVDLDADGHREIVAAASDSSANRFWYVLAPTPAGFEHTYVSDELPGEIHSLLVQQLDADPALEIVIGTGGRVVVIDGATHREQLSWSSPAEEVRSLTLADVDGDSQLEAVFCDSTADGALYVYDFASGTQEFRAPEFRCDGLAVGNVDGDPRLEIVVASWLQPGYVLDGVTRLIEWTYLPGFGPRVVLANLDADPWSEVLAAGVWQHLAILDAVLQQEVASITTMQDVAAVEVLDVEGDGPLEIVYADAQWGAIHVHDAQSLALKWSVENPEHGVTDIAFGNLDADPAVELAWGAGYSSSGPDHLYVVDTGTQALEWQSLDFAGPFFALSHGDVDADGQPELLYGSFESHSGPGDGVWFVHDARTKALEFVSTPNGTNWTGLWRIRNANVDADPQQEIFVTTSDIYDGIIICYDGVTHAEQWRVTLPSGLSFQSMQIGNVDADPGLELVASVDVAHSGAPGVFVYVYDAGTGNLEWQSPDLAPGLFKSMAFLRLGNVDGDPNVEIVVGALHDELWIIDGVTHQVTNLGDQDVTALDLADRDGNGMAELIVGTEMITGPGQVRVVDTSGTVVETVASYPHDISGLAVQDMTGDGVFDYVLAVDEHVLVRDGVTGAESWNSGRLRYGFFDGVAELDSLLVADVDLDGRRELVVNLSRIGLRVFELPAAGDVALFVTDSPDPALVGTNVTYTFRVQNQTSTPVAGVTLTVALPPGATFVSSTPGAPTCTPSGGTLSCALGALGGGAGSTVTAVVSALAPGILSTSATVTSSPSDPTPANNTATATTWVTAVQQADLALAMDDEVAVVSPSEIVTYRMTVANAGPWPVASSVLVDTVPAGLEVFTFLPSVGSYDPGTGAWTGMNLGAGQTAELRLIGGVRSDASGLLLNSAVLSPAGGVSDPVSGNNSASDTNLVRSGWTELSHGVSLSAPIPPGGERFFVMGQDPAASYEVVLDEVSGDLGDAGNPVRLQRLSANLLPLQEATAAGLGASRSLRWQSVGEDELIVRVASGQCASNCGADDVFRVRAYDTTYDLPRFNNTGSQLSVLFVQNTGRGAAHGTVRFWSGFGSLLAEVPFAIQAPNGIYVLATASLVELQDRSGSITVTSDAPYATLAGKVVSLDPATGFSFDTPMRPRPR